MIIGQEKDVCEIQFEKSARKTSSATGGLSLISAKVQLSDQYEGLSVNRKNSLSPASEQRPWGALQLFFCKEGKNHLYFSSRDGQYFL